MRTKVLILLSAPSAFTSPPVIDVASNGDVEILFSYSGRPGVSKPTNVGLQVPDEMFEEMVTDRGGRDHQPHAYSFSEFEQAINRTKRTRPGRKTGGRR